MSAAGHWKPTRDVNVADNPIVYGRSGTLVRFGLAQSLLKHNVIYVLRLTLTVSGAGKGVPSPLPLAFIFSRTLSKLPTIGHADLACIRRRCEPPYSQLNTMTRAALGLRR